MSERSAGNPRIKIRLHYFLALILLLHGSFFLVYWLSVGDFRSEMDLYLSETLDLGGPYTTVLMVVTALIVIWSLFRFIRFRLTVSKENWEVSTINWVFFGVWVLFLVIFYGSLGIILRENPSQRGVLSHLLSLFRLVSDAVLFLIAAVWLRRLILYLRGQMEAAKQRGWLWMAGIVLTLATLVVFWLLPALFPPQWAYPGDLPTKPALLAHRGASMLAPENTLVAAELAANHDAFGFETDVRISLDGVPFLMHDATLARTTNIAEVFPERVKDRPSSFTMGALQELNAGLWFIQKDPFGTIREGLVSQNQLSINQRQHIPTLEEAFALVKGEEMVIILNNHLPPEDHPYHDQFFEIVLDQCLASGLKGNIWLIVDREQLETVLESTGQTIRVLGSSSMDLPSAQDAAAWGVEIITVDKGVRIKDIEAYRDEGLGVNVHTVDAPWLFSQFWLTGVTSVTTNNVHRFSQLVKPMLNLPYSRYLLFWGLYGIIIAIWLAGSQPTGQKVESEGLLEMQNPDLMDFAEGDDEIFNPESADEEPISFEENDEGDDSFEK